MNVEPTILKRHNRLGEFFWDGIVDRETPLAIGGDAGSQKVAIPVLEHCGERIIEELPGEEEELPPDSEGGKPKHQLPARAEELPPNRANGRPSFYHLRGGDSSAVETTKRFIVRCRQPIVGVSIQEPEGSTTVTHSPGTRAEIELSYIAST
jgi:hypothetical protein